MVCQKYHLVGSWQLLLFICTFKMFVRNKKQKGVICYLVTGEDRFHDVHWIMKAVYRKHALSLTHVQDEHQHFWQGIWEVLVNSVENTYCVAQIFCDLTFSYLIHWKTHCSADLLFLFGQLRHGQCLKLVMILAKEILWIGIHSLIKELDNCLYSFRDYVWNKLYFILQFLVLFSFDPS